jgi:selenocysteine lyase/cysteine desulfurase
MTLPEILANEALRQREFPVVRKKTFLAHAGVCPLPQRVSEAIGRYATLASQGDQETLLAAMRLTSTRELAAQFIGAQPGEIAFVGPTSLALSLVAGGLAWRNGENVLVYFDDYPSNVYPWTALAERGVRVRFLKVPAAGWIRPADVLDQVDGQTRLVALASCHFLSGYRIGLDMIGAGLHERGILFCVDGIQTLGAFPTSLQHVDFLAADAHKWLLGPCAAGILFVRTALQDRLRPMVYGWHNVRCPDFVAQEQLALQPDARRYEAGTGNWLGLVGLHAALELLQEIGLNNISAELLRKRAWLVPALQAKGYTVLHADAPEANAGAIITFHRPGADVAKLHARLEQAGVITSLRVDRGGTRYLRLSPHFYNTDAELQRCLDLLD